MGGASPLLRETRAQAEALETALTARGEQAKTFVAMRYWSPTSGEAARAVEAFAPDHVVLLPLYPQYSTTTTASSIAAWRKAYRGPGASQTLCCYPTLKGVVEAHARRIESAWRDAGAPAGVRLLFSAHGLPARLIEDGDPYQAQIEATAAAIAARLPQFTDWRVCYQSRVGPVGWLGPETRAEIAAAGADGLGVVIAPIAFVSEHVETLVELDHDYAKVGEAAGCPAYIRAPALGVEEHFIAGLADAVLAALDRNEACAPGSSFTCDARWSKCPVRQQG
jgi:ferrochelatase